MALFLPPFEHLPEPQLPALVSVFTRGEMEWNRPLFKAPPLVVQVPLQDIQPFFANAHKMIERSSR